MRFLVDECTGPGVAAWLRNLNHEVFSVFEEARDMEVKVRGDVGKFNEQAQRKQIG